MMRYGQVITWTDAAGNKHTASVANCATPEDARIAVLALARASGWTPPRWWQLWRWNDSPGPIRQ